MPHSKHARRALATLLPVCILASTIGCAGAPPAEPQLLRNTGGLPALDVSRTFDNMPEVTDSEAHAFALLHPEIAAAPAPRAGHLLVVFTYGNGEPGDGWGNGLRDIARIIRHQHPGARVITRGCFDHDGIQQTVESHVGPVALVGHSFGGSKSVQLASNLHRAVDWLILLDPVPTDDWAFRHAGKYFEVPACVRRAVCYYRPAGLWPMSYPIVNPTAPDDNRLRRVEHSAFCHNPEVRKCVLEACAEADAVR